MPMLMTATSTNAARASWKGARAIALSSSSALAEASVSSRSRTTACGRPATAGSLIRSLPTGRSDLGLQRQQGGVEFSCRSTRNRRAFICRRTAPAERADFARQISVDGPNRRSCDVRWRAGLLGNVSFRRRWRGRCEGSAKPSVSLHEGWLAHERARWRIDDWRSARRRRGRGAGRDQFGR